MTVLVTKPAVNIREELADLKDQTTYDTVKSAGAVMDAELTNEAAVKSIDQALTTTSDVAFNQVTGALVGNADTATTLATARNIALSGDVTGSASFNGSADISITATVADDSHSHSAYLTEVTANDVNSGAATDGYVLTANGSGGAAWEAASGGLSDGSTLTTGFTFNDNAIAKFGTGGTDLQLKSDGSDIQATLGTGINFYLNAPTSGFFYAAKAGSTGADVSVPARILNSYNSTAANGGGVGLGLASPNGSGNVKNAATIYARYNDVTNGSEDTEVEIWGYTGGSNGEMATIRGDQQSSFPSGITTSSEGNSSQWKAAYDWGNHADAGYVGDSAIGAVGGVQAYDAGLTDIAGLTPTDGNIIVGDGTNWVAENGATARESLGLDSMSLQADDSVDINGGTIDNTAIGNTTPAAGKFTNLTATGTLSGISYPPTVTTIVGDTTSGTWDANTPSRKYITGVPSDCPISSAAYVPDKTGTHILSLKSFVINDTASSEYAFYLACYENGGLFFMVEMYTPVTSIMTPPTSKVANLTANNSYKFYFLTGLVNSNVYIRQDLASRNFVDCIFLG